MLKAQECCVFDCGQPLCNLKRNAVSLRYDTRDKRDPARVNLAYFSFGLGVMMRPSPYRNFNSIGERCRQTWHRKTLINRIIVGDNAVT
ncbi:hypothetical protein [Phaeobacter piscinae]|uniref:hypothetical protein n=1 Tax=Phaeobacter piscinae TaxID=1580596 RepID=UPI000F4CA925|nr:hypothetical protein [Phaeobacter piscinae]